ncbi:sensor histidine kinase [Brachybacterium sp. DNPG3]
MSTASPRRLRIVDALLGTAVALVLALVIALASVGGSGTAAAPTALAYVFALGFGGVLLLRRQLPVGVLVLSVLGTFAYYSLQLPTIGVALPVVAALGSAAEQGRLRAAGIAGAVVVAVALAFRLRDDPQPLGYLLGTDTAMNLALAAAALALGHAIRTRRERDLQQRVIAELTAERADRVAEERVAGERERISRELHDTLGHALSVIALHAGVGREALAEGASDGSETAEAAAALERIREQSSASLQELRAMVRMLRADEAARERHVRSLADLPALLERMRAAGLEIDAEIDAEIAAPSEPRDGASTADARIPALVDAAAYRIVQESLTNVLRHAEATRVEIRIVREDEQLHLTVRDDGRGPAPASITPARTASGPTGAARVGTGLAGMAERARLLGGVLDAGGGAHGGFVVDARLPLPPAAADAPADASADAPADAPSPRRTP